MRVVVQRADGAKVTVDGEVVGQFDGPGLVVLVGVTHDDTPEIAQKLADKVYGMRIFERRHAKDLAAIPEDAPKELSAKELGLPVLVISQFTLYADTRKGRRPTWNEAAPGPVAEPLVEAFAIALEEMGSNVQRGRFGADMQVALTNDGPMTLVLDFETG